MPDGDRAMRPAKALFAYSLLYLFAIFTAYLADVVVQRCWRCREHDVMDSKTASRSRQARRRRAATRSVAIGLALAAFVVIFYVATHRQIRPGDPRPGDVRADGS